MQLTPTFVSLLQEFSSAFTRPSFVLFVYLLTGWALTSRHRFITECWTSPRLVDTQLRGYNHPRRSIMARKRRTYTSEFKAQAVRLVTEQGYSVAEAARSLGIHETLLRSWKQALETPWKPRVTRPFPAMVSSLLSRKSCAACGPRTSACGRSVTS